MKTTRMMKKLIKRSRRSRRRQRTLSLVMPIFGALANFAIILRAKKVAVKKSKVPDLVYWIEKFQSEDLSKLGELCKDKVDAIFNRSPTRDFRPESTSHKKRKTEAKRKRSQEEEEVEDEEGDKE